MNEAQEMVCTSTNAGDMKKLLVAYVSVVLLPGVCFLWQLCCSQGLSDI
jgi:hypothetical protein